MHQSVIFCDFWSNTAEKTALYVNYTIWEKESFMSNEKMYMTVDGNTAAAYTSYAFTELSGIYPITPSSPMADAVDHWAQEGRKNILAETVKVTQMQSEAGAADTVHGALQAGGFGVFLYILARIIADDARPV